MEAAAFSRQHRYARPVQMCRVRLACANVSGPLEQVNTAFARARKAVTGPRLVDYPLRYSGRAPGRLARAPHPTKSEKMRLLVATLATNENELDACVAAIRRQTHQDFEHILIENLPKREAHEKLFRTFMRRRGDVDLLVKVDADMVIRSPRLLERVDERFRQDDGLEVLSIGVQDFFTDRLVSGLNVYRNTVRWTPTGDQVFTDQFPALLGRARFDYTHLAPAADHCPDPHPRQAFHFGVHRGVKAQVALRRGMIDDYYARFMDIDRTWRHYLRCGDSRLALAVLGGELALAGHFVEDQLDYGNPQVEAVLGAHKERSREELEAAIRRVRGLAWGLLPGRLRMEALRGDLPSLPLRWLVPLSWRDRLRAISRRARSRK